MITPRFGYGYTVTEFTPAIVKKDRVLEEMMKKPSSLQKAVKDLEEPETTKKTMTATKEKTNNDNPATTTTTWWSAMCPTMTEGQRQMAALLTLMVVCAVHEYIVNLNLLPVIISTMYNATYNVLYNALYYTTMFTVQMAVAVITAAAFLTACACAAVACYGAMLLPLWIVVKKIPQIKAWYNELVYFGFGVFFHSEPCDVAAFDDAFDCAEALSDLFAMREAIRSSHWWCRGFLAPPYLEGELEYIEGSIEFGCDW